ncbi:glycosyltransferase [Micromonospora sp. CPCC 205371]|nr:glycosyltransferase [Micromonospora sp. CPCC 205371]
MRMLFTSTDRLGHLIPLLPLARAAIAAGHEVSFASPLDDPQQVAALGVPHHSFDLPSETDREQAIRAAGGMPGVPEEDLPRAVLQKVSMEMFARIIPLRALPRLRSIVAIWRPDVVVSEAAEFGGGLIAESFGIPLVRVHYGLVLQGMFERHIASPLSQLREELGLPADPEARRLLDAPQIAYFPAAFEGPNANAPNICRVRQNNGGTTRPARTETIHISFGTEVVSLPIFPQLVRDAVRAAVTTGKEVSLSLGSVDPAQFRDLSGARIEGWVNHDELLPTVRAVICHAGAGTTLRALTAGTPIVAVPQFSDQPMIAGCIAAARVGIAVRPGPDLVGRLTAALDQILTTEPAGCKPMAQAVRDLPSIDHAINMITSLN